MEVVSTTVESLGLLPSAPVDPGKEPESVVKSYEASPIDGTFVVIRYERGKDRIDIYFAERIPRDFSELAQKKHDALIEKLANHFGVENLTVARRK